MGEKEKRLPQRLPVHGGARRRPSAQGNVLRWSWLSCGLDYGIRLDSCCTLNCLHSVCAEGRPTCCVTLAAVELMLLPAVAGMMP